MSKSIRYDRLQPWNPDLVSDVQELVFQLTKSRKKARRVSGASLRALLYRQRIHIAIAVDKKSGKIVGMGTVLICSVLSGTKAWIEDVVVDQKHRRKGIGETLCRMLEQKAKDEGAEHINLTSGNNRIEAHRFYQALGYEPRSSTLFRKTFEEAP